MKKQYYLYIFIGTIVIVLGLLIYGCQKSSTQTNNNTFMELSPTTITEQNQLQINQILDENIFFPNINSANNIIFLADQGKYIYEFNPTTNKQQKKFDEEILGIYSAIYSPSGNSLYIMSNYPKKNIKLYQLNQKNISSLNEKIQNIVWQPNSEKIIYSFLENESIDDVSHTINASNPNGENWQIIKKVNTSPERSIFLNSDNENIYYNVQPTDFRGSDLIKLNTSTRDEKIIAQDSLYISFSPDKQKIIIEKITNVEKGKSKYILIDNNGTENNRVKIDNFYIDKIVWSKDSKFIYQLYDTQALEKIHTETGEKQIYQIFINPDIKDYNQPINVSNLMITTDNKTIYFTSNNKLYSINLP